MIEIKGRIPSKKNSVGMMVRHGRVFKFPNSQYQAWHKDALEQLKFQKPTLFNPSADKIQNEMRIVIFAPDNRASDLTNKAESIMDLLVDAGMIEDDNWFVIAKLTLEFGGVDRENPRAEIYA